MDQYIGKMLDNRYEILECIGTGGMAVVYKARCHRLNRLVAVKILKPELASDAEFRRRFHDESQAVAMLSHSNIVGVYDVSRSDDLDYIVMELIDGMTLKQYMHKRGAPLNWREALHFITQIVRALGHAHSRGIIHRDIKPQNILVLRDGSVKVTDFGIARVASAAQTTLTQEALGSVHYISPEQARGSHIDGRSDLYSAGVVLYEMLTGRLPFEGETPVSVAIQHINSIPIPPRDLNPNIPPAFAAITMKAMAPKPENRYINADDMLAELEEFRKNPDVPLVVRDDEDLENEPTRVVPVAEIKQEVQRSREVTREVKKQPQRNERQSNYDPDDYDDYDEYEDEEPRKKGLPPFLIAIVAILVFVGAMVFFVYNFLIKGMVNSPEPQIYTVPDVTEYTIEEIRTNPEQFAPFKIVLGEEVFSEEPEGNIVSQNPVDGTTVEEGGNFNIMVTVSKGENTIYMPYLIDTEHISATEQLNQLIGDLNITIRTESEHNENIMSGNIIQTIPKANEPLKDGDTIILVVSLGKEKEKVIVPDCLGMTVEQAKSALELRDLEVGEVKEFSSDEYPAGQVMFQSHRAESEVDPGTVISFHVSTGPSEKPSQDPEVEPSGDPTIDPNPDNTTVVATTKEIAVDLSRYSGSVNVRIVVGPRVWYDSAVDTTTMPVLKVNVTDSGVQRVYIYIDGVPPTYYDLDFSEP